MSVVVEARGLEKNYKGFRAVQGISFSVQAGECFALLGPNGAGKSSTIRMISCLSPVSGGSLRVFGEEVHPDNLRIKQRIGVVGQEDFLDPNLTVTENLVIHGLFYGLSQTEARARARELLTFMQLTDKSERRVRELSGGMRRRLVIARGLIGRPDLVILDEPTTGLDPQARIMVWMQLKELTRRGVTLIVTTHYMEEAHRLADRLAVMDHGRILEEGAPLELVDRLVGSEAVEVWGVDKETVTNAVGDLGRVEQRGDSVAILTRRPDAVLNVVNGGTFSASRYLVRPAGLEDVFLLLTGSELRD